MLFHLQKPDGSLFYLLKNREYTVGRKECDILITNDQSISRKHAILRVGIDNVILCDCGSRYNTFVDNTKVEANTDVTLQHGNLIRFGVLASNYTLHGVNVLTTTSSTKSDQKTSLRNNIDFLGGSLVQNWNSLCTHVTVEEIVLTVKVLCAIITGTPIVTLKYWEEYVNNVKQNLPAPNVVDYKPSCSEIILNYQNIVLDYKEERCNLFKNKIFVFPIKKDKDKMIDMIKLAGGEAISWDTSPITKDQIINSSSEYILLQNSVSAEKLNGALLDVITCITQMGKRTIPLQEIALAIIACSCEKDCNPNFDRKGTVLAIKSQTQSQTNIKNVLAHATESQQIFIPTTQDIKTETVIPESLDMVLKEDIVEIKDVIEVPADFNIKVSEEVKSVKRERDSIEIENINVSKKFKTETTSSPSNKRKNGGNESLEIKNDSEGNTTKPSLFAFKNDRPSNDEASPGPSSVVVNPFAKKRKLEQSDDKNAAKRSNQSSSFTSSSSSFLTSRTDPVSNNTVLKSRNSIKPPTVQQKATRSHNVIASSTVNNENLNSFEIDISRIEAVDSGLERSFGWISKTNSNRSSGGRNQLKQNGTMEEIDEEILKYIESFKNTIIIEEEPLVVRKPSAMNNNNDDSSVNNNLKSFKMFKKVQPLKEQTRIISKYVDIVCNDKSSHQVVDEPEDDDGDDDDMGVRVIGTRKRLGGNRFRF